MKHNLNKFSEFLLFLFIIFFINSCSDNETIDNTKVSEPIENIKAIELTDVSYGSSFEQKYDIYLPKDRNNNDTKVFILIHGGAWASGDKNDMSTMADILKLRFPDYAIVNINYRLANVATPAFPMQINDIELLISELKSKALEYQITDNYGFIGSSAGAHLAMLYTYSYDEMNNVKMICSIVGPTNFTDENYTNNLDYTEAISTIQLIFGVEYVTNIQFYKNISPYHVVTSTAPPTILFYGGQDELIPTSQGIDMNNKLNDLGVPNEFTIYLDEGHGWNGEAAIDTANKLTNFILTYF